jgi:Glycosyltransferases involved in cell wall biogenesis
MKKITILVPVHNEQDNLPTLYKRLVSLSRSLSSYQFEFLFVNDGSRDQSLEVIKNLQTRDARISYISFSRNFGKEIAMIAGIDHVDADALVIIDADLQDPPELISKMVSFWEKGYDDVYAKRRTRHDEGWFIKLTSSAFYRIFRWLSDTPVQLDTGDFRLFSRRAVESLKEFRENQRYNKGIFSWIGYKKKEVLFDRDKRASGKSSIGFFKRVNLAVDAITSFSTKPLRLASILGLVISFTAFVYAVILIARKIFFSVDISGYTSIMAAVLLLGGMNLIFIGILGEYVGKIFNEIKKRPLYIIEEIKKGKK